MNDANEVSLESDRLEQLLEEPAPAPPVVMIEYRRRGVPWWVVASLLVLGPVAVVAIMFYYQSMVERYRERAAKEIYHRMQVEATAAKADAVAVKPAPAEEVAADSVSVAGNTEPAPAEPKQAESQPVDSMKVAARDNSEGAALGAVPPAGDEQQDKPRVHTILGGTPLESPDGPADAKTGGGDSAGTPAGAVANAEPAPAKDGKIDSGKEAALASAKPVSTSNGELINKDPDFGAVPPASGRTANDLPGVAPPVEPLPTKEEFLAKVAREAASKERALAEEDTRRAEKRRSIRLEERVRFHNEVRELLAANGKKAGKEIDELARRSGNDHDPKTYQKALNLWHNLQMTQQEKVRQIRALDIPEVDILNFISEHLHLRMRKPGGPRDANEVRTRAAQILLTYELPGDEKSPESNSNTPGGAKERETGGARPQ